MLECAQYEVGKGQLISKCLLVNFVFSKKATKIDEIFTVDLTLTT